MEQGPGAGPDAQWRLRPVWLFAMTLGAIFVGEVVVMVALRFVSGVSAYLVPFLDAVLLCLVAVPVLYVLVLRPLTLFVAEHRVRMEAIEREIADLREGKA